MLPITRKISAYNFYPGNTVEYIVLHDVGALGQALSNANYFSVERGASAHYFTDDTTIVQVVEDFNGAWHVGDGYNKYGINNKNSIGIEMCLTANWKISAATQQNTVDLVHHLKAKYPNAKIVRHYDASRKNCPGAMSANNWAEWNAFKLRLEAGAASAAIVAAGNTYTVVKGDTLYSISKKTAISIETLKTLNGLSSNTLTIGQVLKLSSAAVSAPILAPAPTPVPTVVTPAPAPVATGWKRESGTFSPNREINIRSAPNTGAGITGTYVPGESVRYDSYMNDGTYTWIHYVNFYGANRYMVCRMNGEAWGTFS